MESVIRLINKTPHPVSIFISRYSGSGDRKFITLNPEGSALRKLRSAGYFLYQQFLTYLRKNRHGRKLFSPIMETVPVEGFEEYGNILIARYIGKPYSSFVIKEISLEGISDLNYLVIEDLPRIKGTYYIVSLITKAICPRDDFLVLLGKTNPRNKKSTSLGLVKS